LTPALKNEQNKKHRPLTFHPFVGVTPELIDMPFGLLSGVPNVITHAKFHVNGLRGFSAAAPQKVPFPVLIQRPLQQFCTTMQTVTWSLVGKVRFVIVGICHDCASLSHNSPRYPFESNF